MAVPPEAVAVGMVSLNSGGVALTGLNGRHFLFFTSPLGQKPKTIIIIIIMIMIVKLQS